MSQREDTLKFETGRIKALQEERLHIQKKTFTKWMNSFLQKVRMEVEDLFTDLADGKKLLKLLEIISGEKLGKPNHCKMRVHKIENVNKSLAFLHTKVRLESIGAEDIVDGNPRLILGLIWTIILRFQIQEIEIDVNEDDESSEKKSAKDALLLWCQRKTAGHNGVNIQDFSSSWRNGLGFNALIHSHRPDLIDYGSLKQGNHIDNLNNAFDVAQRELGIPRLLDAEDIDTNKPDEKSVITYVASYYHTFARMKNEMKGGRRIANIVGQMLDADRLKNSYEHFTTNLLEWIQSKISDLKDRNFPNSLEGIQRELLRFKEYRTIEKPPKYKERSEIEALLFAIQTKMKALGQPLYVPPEGKLVHDIQKAWEQLEEAEHSREVALREELLRQKKLENLACRFERKCVVREGYLKEMIQVLSDPRYGSNVSQVEATVKKHEAISADILARKERFENLTKMADQLEEENYHSKEKCRKREQDIMQRWQYLLDLLQKHRLSLQSVSSLMTMLREADTLHAEIQEMEASLTSDDIGRHLMAVEDLLQKHTLVEAQISSQGETIRKLTQQSKNLIKEGHKDSPVLKNKLDKLNSDYDNLVKLASNRRTKLEESRMYFQFVQDHEEEEAWVVERQRICKTVVAGKDLLALVSQQQKHKALEAEIKGHSRTAQKVFQAGEKLAQQRHPESKDVKHRMEALKKSWAHLDELTATKRKHLEDAYEAYQYHADANEAESWMREKLPLVSSKDYGKDEPSAQALLQRHSSLESEIKAYGADIQRLNDQGERMIKSGIATLNFLDAVSEEPEPEEWVDEVRLVPSEEWGEEVVEKEVIKEVLEEKTIPQVCALYPFTGQGMEMQKGEIMILLSKTNADWWNVRRKTGGDGFVPANYVKEIEPKIIRKPAKKTVRIPEKRRVKKTVMKKQIVKVKKERPVTAKKALSRSNSLHQDSPNVKQRQSTINSSYKELVDLSKDRHLYLEDAIHLFGFFRESDDFEAWMIDKEKLLTDEDPNENVEVRKKKFENFLTDLSASKQRLNEIDRLVNKFVENKHSQLDKIKARQQQLHDRWNRLNNLKTKKERSLEGATSVDLFNRTCDEARDWMLEKMNKIDSEEIGRDMKTVQALQRKHENLERELAPVEEKFNRVNLLADSVKASYPSERANVTARQRELQELWDQVKAKAADRRSRLDDSKGLQILMNSSKNLLAWVSDVKQTLNSDEPARDVATAENLLKLHQDLGDDIRTHEDEFADVQDLGKKLLKKNPSNNEIKTTLCQLQEEQKAIHRGWQMKGDWLRQCMDLQVFNREADQIDSITSSHDALLDFEDLGTTLDDVEALLKRHANFYNTLLAQDERLRTFNEMADKLIQAKHYEHKYIDERRHQVLDHRQAVKDKAQQRHELLLASHAYQEFKAEADEMSAWIQEKLKTALDESYRDLTNLERKHQKHEAFEAELRANKARLHSINSNGQSLIAGGHYASENIAKILEQLNNQWLDLCNKTEEKGQKLRQAVALHTYNKTLEDAKVKLDELEATLASDDVGNDLRSVKELLKKHQALESEMTVWEHKVDDIATMGNEMAKDGHFDAPNIIKASKNVSDRFERLKGPAEERRHQLEESFKLHQFNFDIDTEMQWIAEHLVAATSNDLGQNLIDAQNLFKKHQKLEREVKGHQVVIDKTLSIGQNLIDQKHFAAPSIKAKSQELRDSWDNLQAECDKRKKKLELSLKAQLFYSEANEVESWMNEKNDILSSVDYGKDEDAAVKLLTKQKTLELEIDTYSGLVDEMSYQAQKMIDSNHPDSKIINNRMQTINQQIKTLQKLATIRRQKLMESKHRHEFKRESEELESWLNEQIQVALSEDYGQDYEHLLILQGKFADFKLKVDAGEERLAQCLELAKRLVSTANSYSEEIENRQEHLEKLRDTLVELIDQRDQKLQAAGEIHRFNKDVSEALSRIQEKYAAIPDDLGKDLNSVQSLTRKHEVFENDLVALEAQLQVLVDDSVRLQAAYPGGNAEHIAQQQQMVVSDWTALQEKVALRKEELKHSLQLQKFLSMVRDLETWAHGLCSALNTQEKVRDAASAQILKSEHDQIMAEIEAREESFSDVVEAGKMMIEQQHYAHAEVEERLNQLVQARMNLHTAWQKKKVYLDQLLDLHFFLRDAKQLDTLSSQQEVYLSGTDTGATVEEVDAQVKKHEAFEKLMQTQDEKLQTLQQHGGKLLQQNHFESATIDARIKEVTARRAKVKEMSNARRQKLANALMYAQFKRDANEAEAWIDEKKKKLDAEITKGEVTSLEEKMKQLQKHQAFQAELAAHEGSITSIQQKGELLLSKHHEASSEIRQKLENLQKQWKQLLTALINRGKGLEEAQDILEFNNQVEKVEAWIRDKELMVQAGDTGEDYEHCQSLQRKLDDVDSDMRVDDIRMKTINALADKLIRQGRSDTRAVQQRREELNHKWKALQGALDNYRTKLAAAIEVHAFNRDVDDTSDRINEKALTLSVEDENKNLKAVESLQRKQEAISREMTAIESKLKEHDVEGRKLIQKYPDLSSPIRTKMSEVQENWRKLTGMCLARKQRLETSYSLHRFLQDLKELESWVHDMIERMKAGGLGNNIQEAESLLELHQERKAEIDGRQESFKSLKEFGHKLLQQKHPSSSVIEQSLQHLEEIRRTLTQEWEERKQILKQNKDLQIFKEQTKQAESWLASKEAFLNNDDLGDSMFSVEALIKKHGNFEKTIKAQGERIDQLEKFANELIANKHYDSDAVQTHCQAICLRRDRLKESSLLRRKKLQESKQLQRFLRNLYEVEGWINEKIQVASDESYRDFTNLLSKIQKHAAFEAELSANKGQVDAVTNEGEKLIDAGHYASTEIQNQLQELEGLWRQLQDQAALKKERLQDSYQALQFNWMLDDLDTWMDDVEMQLQSEDHGKDLISVQNLLKKHQILEVDITNHAEIIEQVKDQTMNFQNTDHFLKDEIQERASTTIKRYESLHEPVQIRRENLEDALLLQQLYHDVDDELSWISEKEPLASSTDLGSSLSSVQNLQKKHQGLEAEIHAHEPLISSVTSKGRQMIRNRHFAAVDIESKLQGLQSKWEHLKDLASVRRLRLLDAVESHTFYTEVGEAEAWIKEKMPLVTSSDLGKDEDSVLSLMKKLDGIERDIESFNNNIAKLAKHSQSLVERGHFDSETIQKKQVEIETSYQELKTSADERDRKLHESKKFYSFLRETDEVQEWIQGQMVIASSEDYGRDVEHVDILMQKFEGFLSTLHTSEERVTSVRNTARSLIDDGHPQSERIKGRSAEIVKLWEELKDCAHSRQDALAGAKKVHTFDRSADETISWIYEKDAVLSSDDYGHDLESIQALERHHDGFQRDLEAVKEQVSALIEEARRLAAIYPDAKEHIEAKQEEVAEAWNTLLEKSQQRKGKLYQAEELQAYFDDYRELMAWLNEMMAIITSDELAQDVASAEALLARHHENKAEIDLRQESFINFFQTGEEFIKRGHFMAEEIQEKIQRLGSLHKTLLETWEKRLIIYEQSLDLQGFMREAEQLDAWLSSRETMLNDDNYGDSISDVEELIKKHDDFMKTIEAQEDKFNSLNRKTKLEEAFLKLKQEEAEMRRTEAQKREMERFDAMKRKEQKRILDERKREDERRRTQEIVLKKPEENDVKPQDVPEIRTFGALIRGASQKSLDGDKNLSPAKRVESMRMDNSKKLEVPSQIKRAESMKLDGGKKMKRTPSFNTRRRTQSFRRTEAQADLPPVEMKGFLERKHELQSGGKKATIRSWKTYYTVLCGQLLCFFKDENAFMEKNATAPPVSLLQATCSKATNYTKKKHVFRLRLSDGVEFLFMAHDESTMQEWVNKISFHASLPPSMQLLSYDQHKDTKMSPRPPSSADSDASTPHLDRRPPDINSSTSSPASSPEPRRSSSVSSNPQGSEQYPHYENLPLADKAKPPIPPRNSATRTVSEPVGPMSDKSSVKSKIQMFQEQIGGQPQQQPAAGRASYHAGHGQDPGQRSFTTFTISGCPNQNGVNSHSDNSTPSHNNYRSRNDSYSSGGTEDSPPSLGSMPPPLPVKPPPKHHLRSVSDDDLCVVSDGEHDWRGYTRGDGSEQDGVQYRKPYAAGEVKQASVSRHMSLPPSTAPPNFNSHQYSATIDNRHRTPSSEGSSEGDYGEKKSRDKKKGVLQSLFRKK